MPARLQTDSQRRALMQRVRQRGTPAEKVVAEVCRSLGLRYRLNVNSLPGSPDLANKSRRWAIFVNGCFWHHHKACKLGTMPKRNGKFWHEKFRANRRRDAHKIRQLRRAGFKVFVVWQCQTRDRLSIFDRLSDLGEPRRVNPG
jgi:DNA mismatch endonuclease (patch repair protein)